MNTRTTITRALAVYISCLLLLLCSCKKDENCQEKYDQIMDHYYSAVQSNTSQLDAHLITQSQYDLRVRSAAAAANADAAALSDCCCWQKIYTGQ